MIGVEQENLAQGAQVRNRREPPELEELWLPTQGVGLHTVPPRAGGTSIIDGFSLHCMT